MIVIASDECVLWQVINDSLGRERAAIALALLFKTVSLLSLEPVPQLSDW